MKTRREHNEYCEAEGIDKTVCDSTNQWMDEPAKDGGGCSHREKRHGNIDCFRWALSRPGEFTERLRACQAHREADRKTDRCGSKSLQE